MNSYSIEKKNHEILTALHYKPLYNINHSEKWGKKNIQTAGYNGMRTVIQNMNTPPELI